MNIDLDSEYKKLCHIQSIKPGHLKIPIILILIVATVSTVGIPLILYWKWQRFRNFIHLLIFSEVETDTPEVSHYLIVESFKMEGKSRNSIYRNSIVSPYLVQGDKDHRDQGINKYIEHKNLKYVIRNNTLESIKFRINRNLEDYVRQGLSTDEVKNSLSIYGQPDSFSISFFHILRKMLHQKRLRFVFMMFAVKKIVFGLLSDRIHSNQMNEKIVSITILFEIVLTLLMMLGISIFCAKQHNKVHDNIEKKHYKVIRAGQHIEVKIKDLYVGDVVIPEIGQIIYFKGILSAITNVNESVPYCVVNQKLYNRKDDPVSKVPIESSLNQVQQMNTINAGSVILNLGLRKLPQNGKNNKKSSKSNTNKENKQSIRKGSHQYNDQEIQGQTKFFIIVSDNNYMQKFYESYKETCYFDNIDSVRSSYDFQQLLFNGFFFILAFIGTVIASIDGDTHQNWMHLLLSIIILCFPFNLGLFCNLTEIISIVRLKMKNISVVNPMIEQIGISNNLSIELSSFEQLQYRGFIKRSRCNGLPEPQLYENKQIFFDTYRRTKEDSIYAFLGWIGMYNRPYFEKYQVYKKIFQDFGFENKQNEYEDENSNLRITNSYKHIISIDWQELQRFPASDMLQESIVIKNHCPDRPDKKFFTITQGSYTSENCFAYFDHLIHDRATDPWKDVMQRIHMQGKKIQYICSKKLPAQEGERYPKFDRTLVQTHSDFMGFLVFDEWPNPQRMKNLIDLDILQAQDQNHTFSIKIFSVRKQNALIGYDHILRNVSIFHSMESSLRAQQTILTKPEYQGVIHIGNGILDQGSLLAADISINVMSESYGQADFLISQTHQVFSLIQEGSWALYNTTLTVVCLVLFNFSKIVGQLVLFEGDDVGKLGQLEPLSQNYDKVFILDFGVLIVPILLLNLYEPVKKMEKKEQGNFFRIETICRALSSLAGLAILYTIEFIDHGFRGTCEIYENGFKKRHLIELRGAEHSFAFKSNIISCEGIVDFITVSFGLFVILLLDRENSQRKARNLFIGIINKVYMFLLWIGTIVVFQVPLKNVTRALVVIIVVLIMAFLSQLITNKSKIFQSKENDQDIIAAIEQREEQEERQRVRRRIRPYVPY